MYIYISLSLSLSLRISGQCNNSATDGMTGCIMYIIFKSTIFQKDSMQLGQCCGFTHQLGLHQHVYQGMIPLSGTDIMQF